MTLPNGAPLKVELVNVRRPSPFSLTAVQIHIVTNFGVRLALSSDDRTPWYLVSPCCGDYLSRHKQDVFCTECFRSWPGHPGSLLSSHAGIINHNHWRPLDEQLTEVLTCTFDPLASEILSQALMELIEDVTEKRFLRRVVNPHSRIALKINV